MAADEKHAGDASTQSNMEDAAAVSSPEPGGRLNAVCGIVRKAPHVAVVSTALTCLLVALSVWGVDKGAAAAAESARTRARSLVAVATTAMNTKLQQAIFPVMQMADVINRTGGDYALVQRIWQETVPSMWNVAKSPASVALTLEPQGHISNVYNSLGFSNHSVGWDLLAIPDTRGGALVAMLQPNTLLVSGPFFLPGSGYVAIMNVAVFLPVADENESWGMPYMPTDCPPGVCYNPATGMKWWGIVSMTLDAAVFLATAMPVQELVSAGYNLQAFRPGVASLGEPERVAIGSPDTIMQHPNDAVRHTFLVADAQWDAYIWLQGRHGWRPVWERPLYAIVAIGSVIIGILVFTVLLAWEEHRALLEHVLPKAAIKRLRAEMDWNMSSDKQAHTFAAMELETPANQMLRIIASFMEGSSPSVVQLLAVKQALQRSADVYRPAAQNLQTCMQGAAMDEEVQQALVAALVGSAGGGARRNDTAAGMVDDGSKQLQEDEIGQRPALGSSATLKHIVVVPSGLTPAPNTEAAADNEAPLQYSANPLYSNASNVQLSQSATGNIICGVSGQQCTIYHEEGSMIPLNVQEVLCSIMGSQQLQGSSSTAAAGQRISTIPYVDAATLDGVAQLETGLCAQQPERPLFSQLEKCLAKASTWEFDAYALEAASAGRPLSVLAYWLLHSSGTMAWARMDGTKLARFLQKVEEGYPSNPYHNRRHAADVLQSLHVLLHRGGLAPGYADQLTVLGCYLAAVVHDYEHRGRTNDFLVHTHDDLAVRYNDRAPMENHHLAAAWSLLKQPDCSCLSGLSKAEWEGVRKLVIELVLATDMKQHFAIMGQFGALHGRTEATGTAFSRESMRNSARHHVAVGDHQPNSVASSAAHHNTVLPALTPVSDNDKVLSLQMALKCADLGHLAAPLSVHLKWVKALEQEMFLQGDAERAAGLPLSPLCDRTKEGVTKSQVGFFDFVVLPLFKNYAQRFADAQPMLKAVQANYQYWQKVAAGAAAAAATAPQSIKIEG